MPEVATRLFEELAVADGYADAAAETRARHRVAELQGGVLFWVAGEGGGGVEVRHGEVEQNSGIMRSVFLWDGIG
jgi:hypothetical protein